MNYPEQKRYTLDEAAQLIEHETGIPHNSNRLLQLAKNQEVGICFFVGDTSLLFIQLEKSDDKWKSVRCEPLFGEYSLNRVVIPIDKPNQCNHVARTIDPRKEQVFPILSLEDPCSRNALLTFADQPEEYTAKIYPWQIYASDSFGVMKVAIVQQKMVCNSIHAGYTEWQKEHGLPTFNVINKETGAGTAIAEGNFKYFETWTTLEIKRSDLCIPAWTLDGYINRIIAAQNKPDRIKEAITEIKERTDRTFSANQLFREAKENKLIISFSKPTQTLQYVQMDLPKHEHELITCKPLQNAKLIIPKSRTALSDVQEVYRSVDEKIYPVLEGQSLIDITDLHKKKTKIRAWNILAKCKGGNDLIVSSCYRYSPAREGGEYNALTDWLTKHNLPTSELMIDEPDYFDAKFLNGMWAVYLVDGNFIELEILDLFIPWFSLEQFIQSLKDELPEPSTPKYGSHAEWNGKKVKPTTKEKYQRWQSAVDEMSESRPQLSHSAICTRIAGGFNASPETIRKNTKLPTT